LRIDQVFRVEEGERDRL